MIAISASMQAMCERLFKTIGRAELIADRRFRNNAARLQHVDELDAIIQEFVRKHTTAATSKATTA